MPLVKMSKSPSAIWQYGKRFGALDPVVDRSLPNANELAKAALKAGKPDPELEKFKLENWPKNHEPGSLLPDEPDY